MRATLERPTCLDLFCGIGGLTLGMERAGITSVGGIDNWDLALETFRHNIDVPALLADVNEVTIPDIENSFGIDASDIDVIVGGPPCQGFSTVGKRDLDDPRNRLWMKYQDIVRHVRPAYIIIENVEGIIVDNGGIVRDNILRAFGRIGYRMKARILTCADYGVPQYRKRAIFLGWLDGVPEPEYPERTHTEGTYVSVQDAIFDLPELGAGEKATEYSQEPFTEYQEARRGKQDVLHNHEAANHRKSLIEKIKHVSDGGNRTEIPDHLQPKSGFHNSYSRLASWKPAVAVTSNMRKPSSARCTHPKQHRGLTVREGLRLQGFDDDFVVKGRRSKQYKQVGNAVPPLLGKAL